MNYVKTITAPGTVFSRHGLGLMIGCMFHFLFTNFSYAQSSIKDKARIKGVGVVRGKVLEYNAGGNFVFLEKDGDTLVVGTDKVLHTRITKSLMLPNPGMHWHSVEPGLDWGKASQWQSVSPYLSVETNHAYVLNRFLQPGIGAGYQLAGDFHIMPVFASLTGELYRSRISPFYFSNLGYGFAWARARNWRDYETVRGGLLWYIGGGLKIAGRAHATYLKAGYKIQHIYTEENLADWWGTPGYENVSRTLRRVYIGLSFAF